MARRIAQIILEYLEAHPASALKTKDLARALNLPKQGDEYLAVKEALRSLQDEGKIERVDGRKWRVHLEERFAEGVLRIAQSGRGIVTVESGDPREIVVLPRALGDAADGDRVRVRVQSVAEGRRMQGEVVAVLKARVEENVGTLKVVRGHAYVQPDAPRGARDVLVPPRALRGARDGDKVLVRITQPGDDIRNAQGAIETVFGRRGDAKAELAALARRFGLSIEFPAAVEQEAQDIPSAIPAEEIARRLDLRDAVTFTIDPEDAKDFDDAVSISVDADGQYQLGVHIADVSHYVQAGSALDKEASLRGTSVYLVDGVIPMLPERLSNHLCSLKEGQDRLTYTVQMSVSPRGVVKHASFHKSVIRSRRRFTYEEVEAIIESGEGPFCEDIALLQKLATVLMKKRFREGSIDFAVPEVKFVLSPSGYPVDIVAKKRLRSMRLIEECMLLANKSVATAVRRMGARDEDLPFLYRVHDLPDPEKVRELTEFIRHLGLDVRLDPKSSESFQRMIESLRDAPESAVIQDVTIRSMAKAVYSEKNIGHFGLGFALYTHFTSPIRRYPDLVVHRMLHEYQQGNAEAVRRYYRTRVGDIGKHSSERERAAVEAERLSVRIKEVEYMQRHVGDEFDAIISGVTHFGVFVEITTILVEGLVHVRSLPGDYFEFDARRKALVGRRSGKRYRLGDSVRVQVVRVDVGARDIDFLIVS